MPNITGATVPSFASVAAHPEEATEPSKKPNEGTAAAGCPPGLLLPPPNRGGTDPLSTKCPGLLLPTACPNREGMETLLSAAGCCPTGHGGSNLVASGGDGLLLPAGEP